MTQQELARPTAAIDRAWAILFARLVLGEAVGALERGTHLGTCSGVLRRGFGESNGRYCHHGDGDRRKFEACVHVNGLRIGKGISGQTGAPPRWFRS